MLLPQWWHLSGWSLHVPRGAGGISLWDKSVQVRQHGQLASFLGTPLLWETPDLPSSPENCSAGLELQAETWLFFLGEPVSFTHFCCSFKWVLHLGKTLEVSTICGMFLANLAFVWILLFEDHSDLNIWFRPQYCHVGFHQYLRDTIQPAGQCLSSACAVPGNGFGWVKFPVPGVALAWLTPISLPSTARRHLCTAVTGAGCPSWCWEGVSSPSQHHQSR